MENNNFIDLLGEKIRVYVENTNNKNKVLLLHGFNSSFNIFNKLINEKIRNFDIATFDFPGCNLSSNNNPIDLELYKLITIEFIKKYNLHNCIIISHSLGAISALNSVIEGFAKFAILSSPFNYYSSINSNLYLKSFINTEKYTSGVIKYKHPNDTLKEMMNRRIDFAKNLINTSKFKTLILHEMLNTKYISSNVKPLYFLTNKYMIITGNKDFFIPFLSCKKVSEDTSRELIILKNYSHKMWSEISDIDLQLVIELIERSLDVK